MNSFSSYQMCCFFSSWNGNSKFEPKEIYLCLKSLLLILYFSVKKIGIGSNFYVCNVLDRILILTLSRTTLGIWLLNIECERRRWLQLVYMKNNALPMFCRCLINNDCAGLKISVWYVTPWTVALPSSSVHRILQTRDTAVGCHFLLKGSSWHRGSNPCLLCVFALVRQFFTTGHGKLITDVRKLFKHLLDVEKTLQWY